MLRGGARQAAGAVVIRLEPGSTTPEASAPATAITEMPAVITIATMTPTMPPMLTSFLFRLLVPKSTPAAPAVAKKPTIAAIMSSMDLNPPPLPVTSGNGL